MKEYSEEELAFIEHTLEGQEDVDLEKKSGKVKININQITKKKSSIKKDKIPPYKNPVHWVAALIIAPVLLSGALMFLLLRVESMLGSGTLEWLTNDPTGVQVKEAATTMGFEWLGPLAEIYDNRWLIVAILFTFFFIIAIFVVVYDNLIIHKYRKFKKTLKEKREKSKDGEN